METELVAALRPSRRRRIEYRCAGCGYGIVVAGPAPDCPMCGGRAWEPEPWRPFAQVRHEPPAVTKVGA